MDIDPENLETKVMLDSLYEALMDEEIDLEWCKYCKVGDFAHGASVVIGDYTKDESGEHCDRCMIMNLFLNDWDEFTPKQTDRIIHLFERYL